MFKLTCININDYFISIAKSNIRCLLHIIIILRTETEAFLVTLNNTLWARMDERLVLGLQYTIHIAPLNNHHCLTPKEQLLSHIMANTVLNAMR